MRRRKTEARNGRREMNRNWPGLKLAWTEVK